MIHLHGVTKIYHIYDKQVDRFWDSLFPRKIPRYKTFNALTDIDFHVPKGCAMGIVGKNGSGKSTLLKIIAGVLSPTSGAVQVKGKIAALLELGAGFNFDYTGIENVYLNGMMMGFTHDEMERRLDQILDFADIGDFVHQPVRIYSSGMFARLAFSLSVSVDPDILIVDETLAVGDIRFQQKCIERMKELKEKGTTILFVTHATEQVRRFCDQAVWILDGRIHRLGPSSHVVDQYEDYMRTGVADSDEPNRNEDEIIPGPDMNHVHDLGPDTPVSATLAKLLDIRISKTVFNTFDALDVRITYEVFDEKIDGLLLGAAIYTTDRKYVFGPNTFLDHKTIPDKKGRHEVVYSVPRLTLMGGNYMVDAGLFSHEGIVCIDYRTGIQQFQVTNDYFAEGIFYLDHKWEIVS